MTIARADPRTCCCPTTGFCGDHLFFAPCLMVYASAASPLLSQRLLRYNYPSLLRISSVASFPFCALRHLVFVLLLFRKSCLRKLNSPVSTSLPALGFWSFSLPAYLRSTSGPFPSVDYHFPHPALPLPLAAPAAVDEPHFEGRRILSSLPPVTFTPT